MSRRLTLLLTPLLAGLTVFVIAQDSCQDTDTDGDGWTIGDGDCDDENADIHPGADELCNGEDDNCDRVIDAGVLGEDEICAGESCLAILGERPDTPSGSYWIQPDFSDDAFEAYCDMSTEGGGWTQCLKNRVIGSERSLQYPSEADGEDYDFCPFDGTHSYYVSYERDTGGVSFLIDYPIADPTEFVDSSYLSVLNADLVTTYSSSRTEESSPQWDNMNGFVFYNAENIAGDDENIRITSVCMSYWYNSGDFRIGPDLYNAFSEDADYVNAGGCSGSSPESEHVHQGYLETGTVKQDGRWERYETGCQNGYQRFVTEEYGTYDNRFFYR